MLDCKEGIWRSCNAQHLDPKHEKKMPLSPITLIPVQQHNKWERNKEN